MTTEGTSVGDGASRGAIEITGADFVALLTKDFGAARAFYEEVLGLRCSQVYQRIPGGEFETGSVTLQILEASAIGREFVANAMPIALHVADVAEARTALEARDVQFVSETFDSGVCWQAIFRDPDGNVLGLHHRYAPMNAA